jgi:uncharacterized metal-binding protein YceD (DUF177 family)
MMSRVDSPEQSAGMIYPVKKVKSQILQEKQADPVDPLIRDIQKVKLVDESQYGKPRRSREKIEADIDGSKTNISKRSLQSVIVPLVEVTDENLSAD